MLFDLTGDKDMLQLVGGPVTVLAPASKGDDYAKLDKIAAGLLAFTHDVAHGRAD